MSDSRRELSGSEKAEVILSRIHPQMKPIKRNPTLFTLNGCGVTVYGSRDFCPHTTSYVKTYFITLVFVPILPIGAYRVVNAPEGGWYFLGKEPLGFLAKIWNRLTLLALLLGVIFFFWQIYTHSPEYLARRKMEEARGWVQKGLIEKAAEIYSGQILKSTPEAPGARRELIQLLKEWAEKIKPSGARALFYHALQVHRKEGIFPNLLARGMKIYEKYKNQDPQECRSLLQLLSPLGDKKVMAQKEKEILEILYRKDKSNLSVVTDFALLLERENNLKGCQALLEPLKGKLGTTEGARILGQIYAREGRLEDSHRLLLPYVQGRLDELHKAERVYSAEIQKVWEANLNSLRTGKATDFNFRTYQNLSRREQDERVQSYLQNKVKDSPQVKAARLTLSKLSPVVAVALDLGIVKLQKAQFVKDLEKRKEELKDAEKIFLTIRGVAGKSDRYLLSLGQVYYWMERYKEGEDLFSQVLEKNHRKPELLLGLAQILRTLGLSGRALTLLEEAYEKASQQELKYSAAMLCALSTQDTEEDIKWLKRANPKDPTVQSMLNSTLGRKALGDGNYASAIQYLGLSIQGYRQMPKNSGSLNNWALDCFMLFQITNNPIHYKEGLEKLEEAVSLSAGDSILLFNLAYTRQMSIFIDTLGDLSSLWVEGQGLEPDDLEAFYKDEKGLDLYRQKYLKHPSLAKTLANFRQVLLLAPKYPSTYSLLSWIYSFTRNREALKALAEKIHRTELDLKRDQEMLLKVYGGKADSETSTEFKRVIGKLEKQLKKAREGRKERAFTLLAHKLIRNRISADSYQLGEDPHRLVQLAEEARSRIDSEATRDGLVSALLYRAGKTLEKQSPEYAALVKKTRYSLDASFLLPYVLTRPGKLRDLVLQNSDVKRATEITLQMISDLPSFSSPWRWAMVQASHRKIAQEIARKLTPDSFTVLKLTIKRKLQPLSASQALKHYWLSLSQGNRAEGERVLEEFRSRGVPLP